MKNQMTMQEQLGYGKQDPVMHGQAGRKWLGAMNAERVQGMELQNEAMQIHNDFMEYENRMRKDMADMQRKRAQVLLSIADCAARNGGMVPVGMISPFDAALGGTGSYGGSMLTGTGRGTRLRSVRARNGQAYGYDPVAYSPADIIRLDKSYGGVLSDAARNFYLQNATKGLTDKQIRDMGLVYESKADVEKAKGDAALELEKLKGGNALELEKLKGKSRLAEQEAKSSGMDSKSLADVVDKLGALMRDPEAMKNPWTKAMLEGVFKQNNWALPKLQDGGIAGVETITQGEGDAGGEKKYTPEQIETMQKEIAERKERSELSSLMAGGDGSQELIEYTDDKGARVQTNGYRTKSGKIYDSRGNEIKDYSKPAPKSTAEDDASSVSPLPSDDPSFSDNWGKRNEGSGKGRGWLGAFKMPDGGVATEFSVGVNIGGKEVDIPTLVPGLSDEQVKRMVTDIIPNKKKVPDDILNVAAKFAKERMAQGKSPFAGPDEDFYSKKNPAPENAEQAKDKGTQNAASEPEKAKDSGDKFLDDTLAELEKDVENYEKLQRVKAGKEDIEVSFPEDEAATEKKNLAQEETPNQEEPPKKRFVPKKTEDFKNIVFADEKTEAAYQEFSKAIDNTSWKKYPDHVRRQMFSDRIKNQAEWERIKSGLKNMGKSVVKWLNSKPFEKKR